MKEGARELMSRIGLRVLAERDGVVDSTALGPRAREEEPLFWQVGGLIQEPARCFELAVLLEDSLDLHVASCSTYSVVYKALGTPAVLGAYYPDLRDPRVQHRGRARPQPLLHQHLAELPARAALRSARPQR